MNKINVLLALLRISILNKQADLGLFENLGVEDWKCLFNLARQHGVIAIAFNGIEKACITVPKPVLIKWYATSSKVKSLYQNHKRGIRAMLDLYKDSGAEMFVVKGLSLSKLYPDPKAREFGDVDMFTFPTDGTKNYAAIHNLINKKVEASGVKVEYWDKHDVFDYAGVHFEHHSYFVDNDTKSGKLLNRYLIASFGDDKGVRITDGLFFPSANFNILYLLSHTISHMAYEGATLKNILDWGVFLLSIKDLDSNIDWDKTKSVLTETGWIKGYNVLTAVAGKVLDTDFSSFYIGDIDEKLSQKVFDIVIDTTLHEEANLPLLKRIYKKTRRILSRRWMYSSGIIPAHFWREAVINSLVQHIRRPEQI